MEHKDRGKIYTGKRFNRFFGDNNNLGNPAYRSSVQPVGGSCLDGNRSRDLLDFFVETAQEAEGMGNRAGKRVNPVNSCCRFLTIAL